jgi:hypothetical protein
MQRRGHCCQQMEECSQMHKTQLILVKQEQQQQQHTLR